MALGNHKSNATFGCSVLAVEIALKRLTAHVPSTGSEQEAIIERWRGRLFKGLMTASPRQERERGELHFLLDVSVDCAAHCAEGVWNVIHHRAIRIQLCVATERDIAFHYLPSLPPDTTGAPSMSWRTVPGSTKQQHQHGFQW